MASRKARRFRAIFARNFRKIHTFFMKYWYFSELLCDKKKFRKIIWNEFSFHTVFMKLVMCFISPCQRLGDTKHTTRFINTVWNENSFQILNSCPHLWENVCLSVHLPRQVWPSYTCRCAQNFMGRHTCIHVIFFNCQSGISIILFLAKKTFILKDKLFTKLNKRVFVFIVVQLPYGRLQWIRDNLQDFYMCRFSSIFVTFSSS